ncbi:MAG: hypothetical protein A2Y73_08530 [Chloroflexi bacterium RBG_13_56_8]|nr:MAG: hypothetical protein A2Y73_08530 [Chloroflexi bacterium RBG_13_56_8]
MKFSIPTTVLGRTGLRVTRLGIGGGYCKTVEGYRAALDCGINYIDTARAYRDGEDEKVIGEAISGQRDQIVLATKTQQPEVEGARRDLEASLQSLRTNYVDIWQMHDLNSQAQLGRVLKPKGFLETALRAREEGLIRFIGVTGHDWQLLQKAVATGHFDTVLCWYNCTMKSPERNLFPESLVQNAGVVIMNASRNDKLFGGKDAPPPEDFYRYVLSHPAVHLTLRGLRNIDLFLRIARSLSERDTLAPQERNRLEEYGERMRAAGKLE